MAGSALAGGTRDLKTSRMLDAGTRTAELRERRRLKAATVVSSGFASISTLEPLPCQQGRCRGRCGACAGPRSGVAAVLPAGGAGVPS